MTTVITYLDSRRVQVATDAFPITVGTSDRGLFVCSRTEFCHKYHNGVWDSRVMFFVPKADQFDEHYDDHSGRYFDQCVVCHVPTNGNRYCGPSCESYDQGGVFDQGWPV